MRSPRCGNFGHPIVEILGREIGACIPRNRVQLRVDAKSSEDLDVFQQREHFPPQITRKVDLTRPAATAVDTMTAALSARRRIPLK